MDEVKATTPKLPEVVIQPIAQYELKEQLTKKGMQNPLPIFIEVYSLLEANKVLYRSSISKFFLNQQYIESLIMTVATPTDIHSFKGDHLFLEIASRTEQLIGKYVLNASYFTNTFPNYEQQKLLEKYLVLHLTQIPSYGSMHLFLTEYFLVLDSFLAEVMEEQKEVARKIFEMTTL